ncbi:MAG: peptidoglycan-binding protein, partial [Octadecabacter sp.]|nr:peptidoglycan-binding protein [Octadecabacter sp.]
MALSRRTGARFQASIWPGFVDAMTGLLLVLMFVLTIFMVLQFVLQETITGQENELTELSAEVAALAQALGLERDRSEALNTQVGSLFGELGAAQAALAESEDAVAQQNAIIARLTEQRDSLTVDLSDAQNRITGFEAQVAGLLAQRREAEVAVAGLEA